MSDPRWQAVCARREGDFVYAVRTTGVFCRPTCASRRPRRENVEFFAGPADAERAGYRACKRCRPAGGDDWVADLCRFVESSAIAPTLDALAARAGRSKFHVQRVFKAATGLSPRAYHAMGRVRGVGAAMRDAGSVTEGIYAAGFESSGRFYEADALGMTPTRFRRGGAGERIRFAVGACSLGAILVAATERGVCAISLGDDAAALVRELEERFPRAELLGGDPAFERWVALVVGAVESGRTLDLPLDVRGTAFQRRVWAALREIPAGSVASYEEVSRRIGLKRGARAVAAACAANVLAVAIPCHRVVRSDGNVSGYRWGVARKKQLLAREAG